MNFSFKEKSTLVSMVVMLVVWGYYFNEIRPYLGGGDIERVETIVLFVVAIVFIVVLNIIGHIVIAISNPDDLDSPSDERDRLIEQKAGNISGIVLGIAALLIASAGMFQDISSVLMAHLILLAIIISQVSEDALRLYYYRRGF